MAGKDFVTNSDVRERQRFEIINNTTNADVIGVKTRDGREVKYNQQGKAVIDDPGLAREIHYSSGQGGSHDCVVVPVEAPQSKTHRRTFTVPALPWHKEDE